MVTEVIEEKSREEKIFEQLQDIVGSIPEAIDVSVYMGSNLRRKINAKLREQVATAAGEVDLPAGVYISRSVSLKKIVARNGREARLTTPGYYSPVHVDTNTAKVVIEKTIEVDGETEVDWRFKNGY